MALTYTDPAFSTMTSVVAPCLSALLLSPLLLLLLASSAYEQVRVVYALSGAAALACSWAQPMRRRRPSGSKTLLTACCRIPWRRASYAGVVGSPLPWELPLCSVW
jgi:hypothetical protein